MCVTPRASVCRNREAFPIREFCSSWVWARIVIRAVKGVAGVQASACFATTRLPKQAKACTPATPPPPSGFLTSLLHAPSKGSGSPVANGLAADGKGGASHAGVGDRWVGEYQPGDRPGAA